MLGALTHACASSAQKRLVYGHILIYKCHKFTQAFLFLYKGLPWQSVLILKHRISIGRLHTRRQTEHREGDN